MNAKPILFVTLSLLIVAGAALSNLRPVAAAPVVGVNLDANSTSQTDVLVSSSANQAKSFRIGAVVNATSANQVSGVFGWQFTINYNATAFIPQGDPSAASLYPDGAANTVLFGAQTIPGAANWAGIVAAHGAFGSSTISASGSSGQINVFLTLLPPSSPQTLSVSTLLANVQFELLSEPSTPQPFTITNVLFIDSGGRTISNTSGFGGNETVTNSPPVAVFTSIPAPQVGPYAYSFDATGSGDSDGTIASPGGYLWDFGDGTQDLGATGPVVTHDFGVIGNFNVTLRVQDNLGATGAARDSLGNVIVNSQPSHAFATINLIPFNMRANATSAAYFPGGTTGFSIVLTSIGGFVGNIDLTATISPPIAGAPPPTATPSTVELRRVTLTTVSCASAFITIGGTTTCAATVDDLSPGATTPTGIVSFTQTGVTGSFTNNPCTLSGGSCSVTFSALATGKTTIIGTYGGDAAHSGSSGSDSVTGVHPTSITLSCTPASVPTGTNATCTASVTDTFASPATSATAPSGSVSFLNTTGIGTFFPIIPGVKGTTCALGGSGATTKCAVNYEPTKLGTGTHTIVATYGGDSTHATSTITLDVTVTQGAIATTLSYSLASIAGASTMTAITTSAPSATVEPSNSSLVTVTFPSTAPLLNYTLTVTATSGSFSRVIMITLLPTAIRVDPSLVKGLVKGQTFTANIDATVAGAIGWQFTLHYDPLLLSTTFRSVTFGQFWANALANNQGFPVIQLNQTKGTLTVAVTLIGQTGVPITPFSGNGTFASVVFTVISYDNSSLHIDSSTTIEDVNSHTIPVSSQTDGLFDNRLPHDIAVTSVSVLPTTVTAGSSVTVTVVVKNKGLNPETMGVAVTAGGTSVGQQQVSINQGEITTLHFSWLVPSSKSGTITIQAQATINTGDGDGSDNTLTTTLKVNAQTANHTSQGPDYTLYGGLGAAAAIAAVVALLFVRRRRKPRQIL